MMFKHWRLCLAAILLVSSSPSSSAKKQDNEGDLLAVIELEDGGTAKFYEFEEGEMAMIYDGPANDVNASEAGSDFSFRRGLRGFTGEGYDPEEEDLTPSELYAQLIGGNEEDVPPELLEAQDRMEKMKAEEEDPEDYDGDYDLEDPEDYDEGEEEDGDGRRLQSCTSGIHPFCKKFEGCICGSSCRYDYWRCRSNQRRGVCFSDYAYRMASRLQVVRGYVCHAIQEKSWGRWKNRSRSCLGAGRVNTMQRWGLHRTRRICIYSVDSGDVYHHAAWNYG